MDLYFKCVWSDKPEIEISEKKLNGTEIGSVKWRGQPITIRIIGSDNVVIDKKPEKYPPDLYALLKSSLQKQVRRQKPTAIATASRLWELGKFELLRRLIIIAGEDACISKETVIIIWLMMACSKGLVLKEIHRQWVLGYVKALVDCNKCVRIAEPHFQELDPNLSPVTILESKHPNKYSLVLILSRTSYGGLKGDPPMLSRCIDYHFANNTTLPEFGVSFQEPGKLLVHPAGIDFHICPNMLQILSNDIYDAEYIKTVIWECSSGVNYRHPQDNTEYRKCWLMIRGRFFDFGKEYLTKILQRYDGL